MERVTRIKEAMKKLGIRKKSMYTIKELENISKEAKCEMYEVMRYLSYGK